MCAATITSLAEMVPEMVRREASDLHLVPGHPPVLRVHGELEPAAGGELTGAAIRALIAAIAPAALSGRIGLGDVDFAAALCGGADKIRVRVNCFSSRGEPAACLRVIPARIPTIDELRFPEELAKRIDGLTNGLALFCGIAGAGKSSSLAALVQRFNARGGQRIITIEEPVEYLFPREARSIVSQREVGLDVASFEEGLRSGLRQDPDVLLVGEIRDRATAQLALSAAETGHLIFSTLHTADAKGAITRLVDLFPPEAHDDVRTQLSLSLRWVVCQHLLPPAERGGRRVLAIEALTTSHAVRAAIRAGKVESLESAIQSGRKDGMISLDAYLRELVQLGRIDLATARLFAKDATELGG